MTRKQWFHFFSLFLLLTAMLFAASCSGIDDPLAEEESNAEDEATPASSEELTDEEAVEPQELADDLEQVNW